MRAGRLRDSITIQHLVDSGAVDDYGNPVKTWTTFATHRASKEQLSGREFEQFQSDQTVSPVRFVLRYLPGVTASMRVLCDGVYFGIISVVDQDNRHRELTLYCEEKSYADS